MIALGWRRLRLCQPAVATAIRKRRGARPSQGTTSGILIIRQMHAKAMKRQCVAECCAHREIKCSGGCSCGSAPTDAMYMVYLLCSVGRPVSPRVAGTEGCCEWSTRAERAISAPVHARSDPTRAARSQCAEPSTSHSHVRDKRNFRRCPSKSLARIRSEGDDADSVT
jgi:hypothetical protein